MSVDIPTKLKRYAIRLLGKRSYSYHEIRTKLATRVDLYGRVDTTLTSLDRNSLIEGVISYLSDHKLLDDREYARTLQRMYHLRHKSNRVIIQLLQKRGIPRDIIAEVTSVGDESQEIELLVRRKLIYLADILTDITQRQKLMRSLLGKGFAYTQIDRTIRSLLATSSSDSGV